MELDRVWRASDDVAGETCEGLWGVRGWNDMVEVDFVSCLPRMVEGLGRVAPQPPADVESRSLSLS
jgi:hypothetical protein